VSESAESAKRGWVWFGAKPAQSETPVRAAVKRRPPESGEVEKKRRSYLECCPARCRRRGEAAKRFASYRVKSSSDLVLGWCRSSV
jgi:hypothetical protein